MGIQLINFFCELGTCTPSIQLIELQTRNIHTQKYNLKWELI